MKIVNILKFIFLCSFALILMIFAFISSYDKVSSNFEITFLDVGHGDCIYIKTPDNYRLLVDSGDKGTYKNYLKKFMGYKRIKYVDAAVVTHFDSDHIYGLLEMFGNKRVDKVYYPLCSTHNYLTEMLFRGCEDYGIEYKPVEIGDIIYEGKDGVKIEVMYPTDLFFENTNVLSENNESIVIMIEYMSKKFLLMGDIEETVEKKLVEYLDLKADVLKIGHHGSDSSTSYTLLSEVLPDYSVISCGDSYEYGLPSDEVVNRLGNYDSKIYNTNTDGNITFIIDNQGNFSIKTSKHGG